MKQLSILFRGTLGFPFPVSGAFALCLLLLASCGGDDSSDEGYAAIESGIVHLRRNDSGEQCGPCDRQHRVAGFLDARVGCRPGGTRLGFR